MLVEGRDELDAPRAVMDLVEEAPQDVHLVAPAVPPVEDERRDEVADEAADHRPDVVGEMEQRPGREPFLPRHSGEQDDSELAC